MAGQTPRVHQVWPLTQLFIVWGKAFIGFEFVIEENHFKGFLWGEEVADFRKFQGHQVSH